MSVTVHIEGSAEVQAALKRISEALDPVAILDEASALILSRIRIRFRAEVDPEGQQWAPLSPKTITERLRKGFGASPILYRTGRLFNSIQLARDGEFSRVIKTDVEYASYLQSGSENMPARPFLGVSNDDVPLVSRLVVKRVQDALR